MGHSRLSAVPPPPCPPVPPPPPHCTAAAPAAPAAPAAAAAPGLSAAGEATTGGSCRGSPAATRKRGRPRISGTRLSGSVIWLHSSSTTTVKRPPQPPS